MEKEESDETTTFHIVSQGLPLCRFSGEIPERWPTGHRFISLTQEENYDRVNCPLCRERLESRKKSPH